MSCTVVLASLSALVLVSRLRELVEGKVVILRVSRLQNREELVRRFPVLARLGEGIAQNYVACYVDVANAEKKWVTDILVEEGWQVHKPYCSPAVISWLFSSGIGLAWPDLELDFPASASPAWALARVSHVTSPNAVWCCSAEAAPQSVSDMYSSLEGLVRRFQSEFCTVRRV